MCRGLFFAPEILQNPASQPLTDTNMQHPADVLFAGEKPFPILPAVDHYAGSEKLMRKALALQQDLGPIFDITCDCEDGAHAGAEAEHAAMAAEVVLSVENRFGRVGVRIHDITHPHWQRDLDILVGMAGQRLAFVTLPKVRSARDAGAQIDALRACETANGITRPIPVHILIETHGALREAWEIAALPGVESLDFGLMDFVSGHHGAIPGTAMTSPGQFTHPLVVRAKTEIAAAALANGVIPSHNVTTELRDIEFIRHDAERARREFGYLRMWSIHPNQIQPIVAAMRPDFSEVEAACDILIGAQDAGWGPIQHHGKLHDRASYRYYWELLLRARATGMPLDSEPEGRFFV
jgi:citrate lyase subunit beta/citryl-CoA lyase